MDKIRCTERERTVDAPLLKQSFDEFTRATAEMQRAFNRLENKFQRINKELEQKNSELETALAEKEEIKNYLQNILESLVTGVIVTDLKGTITVMNGYALKVTGLSSKGVDGATIYDLFEDSGSCSYDASAGCRVDAVTGQRYRMNGRVLEISSTPIAGKDDAGSGTIWSLRDVTRLQKLEEMAKRTEKFAAMGALAANIAHEIRNPLGSIELFASLLIKDPHSERSQNRASEIVKSVKRVNNKISNLLLFAKRPNPLMRKLELHPLLDDVLSFARPFIPLRSVGRVSASLSYTISLKCTVVSSLRNARRQVV